MSIIFCLICHTLYNDMCERLIWFQKHYVHTKDNFSDLHLYYIWVDRESGRYRSLVFDFNAVARKNQSLIQLFLRSVVFLGHHKNESREQQTRTDLHSCRTIDYDVFIKPRGIQCNRFCTR